jgi:hypothetical protein
MHTASYAGSAMVLTAATGPLCEPHFSTSWSTHCGWGNKVHHNTLSNRFNKVPGDKGHGLCVIGTVLLTEQDKGQDTKELP